MKRTISASVAAMLLTASASAQERDYTLDTAPAASPDGMVIFTLTVPYELSDVHPDAVSFSMSCSVLISYPRGGETYNSQTFSDERTIDLTASPLSPDGARDLSGELVFQLEVPADKAADMLNSANRASYRCDAAMDEDPSTPVTYTVSDDRSGDMSRPAAVRGRGSGSYSYGAVWGDIILPAGAESDAPPRLNRPVDPSILPRPKLPSRNLPKLPDRDDQ